MYPKSVLLRYGEALPTAEKTAFLAIVQGLRTETHQGIEIVMGGALSAALKGTVVAHTEQDLAKRWLEFTDVKDIRPIFEDPEGTSFDDISNPETLMATEPSTEIRAALEELRILYTAPRPRVRRREGEKDVE